MSMALQILLVDDHPLVRLGLATLVEREPDLRIAAHCGSASEALELDRTLNVDLVVVDIMLPNGDGIALARSLRARRDARILGLSVLDDPARVAELVRAGATGFALKTQPFDEIAAAMRAALAGVRYIAPALREEVERLLGGDDKAALERLTPREREIFELLTKGLSNAAIGSRLSIAARTVDTHRQSILKKLGAHSIADLVRLAARWGALA